MSERTNLLAEQAQVMAGMDEASIAFLNARAGGKDTSEADARWKALERERRRIERRLRRIEKLERKSQFRDSTL